MMNGQTNISLTFPTVQLFVPLSLQNKPAERILVLYKEEVTSNHYVFIFH
jgi:hypothetical protein